ncbi:DUF7344 domain-containing protein [Halovivax gelatinilyticus]|uniref:DUF7344 domain-containing protein n=1 Tax=Halovivax gelatinilyticus TaxID=2961597 RepID=UPI0020CA9BAA|nr:hypothetical protein [Halovivax gelatinilyticus]
MTVNALTGTDHASRGDIFGLLSNRRRRYTIHYCKQVGEPVSLGELAEQVAAWELDKEIAEITSAERKRVYTALQQSHLPTLERANVIEFDNHTIELTDEADALEIYLDIVPADSIPWGVYYLGLSLLGFVVLGGIWIDAVPTGTVPALGWAAIVLVAVAVSAVTHVITSRRYRLGTMERPP